MSYVPAKKNTAYIFYAGLVSRSTGQFQANPTLAAGDFKVSIDGGALNNLATLPTVTPAASKMVKISMSAAEMNGDNITIVGSDAAGAEWDDIIVNIQTSVNQIDDIIADTDNIQTRLPAALSGDGYMMADMRSIDDELTSGNNATLNLKALNIVNSIGIAIYAAGSIYGIYASGESSNGIYAEGGEEGIYAQGLNTDSTGFRATGYGTGAGILANSIGTGKSIDAPQDIALPSGDLDDQLQALPTAAEVTDAVWDEVTAGHTTAGTTGKALIDAGSAGDPWTTMLPGAYGAGTAGDIIGNKLDMPVSDVPTADENADALLKRDWTAVVGEASRSVLNALRKIRNKVSFDGANTLTITKEDDTTTAYTQGVVEDANQDPFKEVG